LIMRRRVEFHAPEDARVLLRYQHRYHAAVFRAAVHVDDILVARKLIEQRIDEVVEAAGAPGARSNEPIGTAAPCACAATATNGNAKTRAKRQSACTMEPPC
jgi:hypothetical protein